MKNFIYLKFLKIDFLGQVIKFKYKKNSYKYTIFTMQKFFKNNTFDEESNDSLKNLEQESKKNNPNFAENMHPLIIDINKDAPISVVNQQVSIKKPPVVKKCFDANFFAKEIHEINPVFFYEKNHPIFTYDLDSKEWLKNFEETKDNKFRHQLRIVVAISTIGISRRGQYVNSYGKIVKINDPEPTQVYDFLESVIKRKENPSKCHIRVFDRDVLKVAKTLVKDGYKPLVLNMASSTTPNGGFFKGDGAQEEYLSRCSNYYKSLNSLDNPFSPQYPLSKMGIAYTKNVCIFRDREQKGYRLLDEPFYVDMCAIAAERNPQLENKRLNEKSQDLLLRKIGMMIRLAIRKGNDSLVLSALGCGAFNNPPHHVAEIFKIAIAPFLDFFKYIIFAIVDDHNSKGELQPEGNFAPFYYEFFDQEKKMKLLEKLYENNNNNNNLTESDLANLPQKVAQQKLILCNEKNCEDAYNINSDHYKNFKHICRWNTQCKDKGKNFHEKYYFHKDIPQCGNDGMCTKLINPDHREQFYHQGLPDHMTICRYGKHCKMGNNIKHLQSYKH